MKKLLNYLVLPSQISDFERGYLRRMNRVGLVFFLLHLPVFCAIAFFNDTGPLLALGLTSAVLVGPFIAYKAFENPRSVTLVYGFTSMLMGGLLVHFGQGPMQIEMHFYFFALLAMLALYGNPLAIVTAAVTVAAHHLLLWLYLPSSVFNYDAPIWVVLVHAAFVVLESIATCFIARSFFDNVIGLEKIVQARTEELAARTRDMRLVLDNVNQGFLTIDKHGVMSKERSKIVEKWLGSANDNTRFADYVAQRRPSFAANFSFAWNEVIDGIMPLELTVDQLPKQFSSDGRHYEVQCKPIQENDEFEKALIVISDVTSDVQRQRLEAEQRDVVALLGRIAGDRDGVLEFFEEANALINVIEDPKVKDLPSLKRAIHTLKGNSMLFGVSTIGDICHELEHRMDLEGQAPSAKERHELVERWRALCNNIDTLLGERGSSKIEIDDEEYERVLRDLLHGEPHASVAARIAAWKLEPTEKRLERIAQQAEGIAKRLGKQPITVDIQANQLRLSPARWSTFWASFVHVLRNAIDHGLEAPEERLALSKPAAGTIRLTTRVEGERFLIELSDDGRGIDWESVAQRAEHMGLEHRTHAALVEALFADGLSTKRDVSEYSGRGVGMGAIKNACAALEGSVAVRSRKGEGTTVEFSFPVSAMCDEPLLQIAS